MPVAVVFAARVTLVTLAALALSACAAAGHTTAFDAYAERRGLALPPTVRYDDFAAAAKSRGAMEVEEMLIFMQVPIVGAGADKYLRRADLLRACGEDCDPESGLGDVLLMLLEREYKR